MKKIYFPVIFLSTIVMVSCGKKQETEDYTEAAQLFENSATLLTDFTNQIRMSKDSLIVDSLSELLDKRLTEINFSVPPQTDLKLSEQDNDSLYVLMKNFRSAKKLRLEELSRITVDSVPEE